MDIKTIDWAKPTQYEGAHTWSRIADYEKCPMAFRARHIEKLPEPSNPYFIKGTRVHNELDQWLHDKKIKLPPEAVKMALPMKLLKRQEPRTEENWAFDKAWKVISTAQFKPGDYIRAKIDAFVKKKRAGKVIDFKSGQARGADPSQTRFYAALALIEDPKLEEAQTEFWYVEHDKIVPGQTVTRANLPIARAEFQVRIDRVSNERRFGPAPGDHCRWCALARKKGGPCKFG